MIKDYFTDKTKIFEIESKKIIRYNKDDEDNLHLLAQKISEETNVPKSSIFNGEFSCRIGNWHKINDQYYYFKPITSHHAFFNELLGEQISKYFDLDTIHYQIARLSTDKEEQYGIVSKNFCDKKYTYISLSDYITEISNRDDFHFFEQDLRILDKIRIICKSEKEFRLLQDDFKKLFIRHFYNNQADGGNCGNIMLKITPNGKRLAPLFDYEEAYIDYENLHRCLWNIGELNITDENTQNLFKNDSRFQELLYKLMDADISEFISETENIHNIVIPPKQKDHYKKYESKIKKLVLENGLIK